MKTITIPRLELMAATIGARLFSSVKHALKISNIKTYFWTDSSTVLLIRREQWSVFVANRISEIRKLTTSEDWFHIFQLTRIQQTFYQEVVDLNNFRNANGGKGQIG
ncbi:uncharacterized protein TNCV_1402471 [Trichonephila clavipes]|nr:uncharacterized protein TNCV_1402471 [Trichonephila clavipes]